MDARTEACVVAIELFGKRCKVTFFTLSPRIFHIVEFTLSFGCLTVFWGSVYIVEQIFCIKFRLHTGEKIISTYVNMLAESR
jgi:hypothetical protein